MLFNCLFTEQPQEGTTGTLKKLILSFFDIFCDFHFPAVPAVILGDLT